VSQTRLREVISSRSLLPYLAWRAGVRSGEAKQIRLRSGEKLILRPEPATDLGNAMEVFLFSVYDSPRLLSSVRRIVDLGANVGYSVLYFARRFPESHIVAWEPHPEHVRQLKANVAANKLERRVSICPAAAGAQNGAKWLIDRGTSSCVVDEFRPDSVRIDVRDWLQDAGADPIDLLKMDVEGGEYDLLFDDRFARLSVSNLVVECHSNQQRPRGDEDVSARLRALGFSVEAGHATQVDGNRVATLWGFRNSG
jgi:FkbM family methyltransferase